MTTPHELTNQTTKHPEARIFADMLHGPNQESIESLAADVAARFRKTQGGAGPRNTANSGSETPPALPGDHPSSAEVLASVRRGERDNDHQDARRDWIRAKLLEAAQDQ
jgi:hypothetical protein